MHLQYGVQPAPDQPPGPGHGYDNNFSNQLKHPTTSSEHLDNFCKPFMEKN